MHDDRGPLIRADICLYEDRSTHVSAVQVLVASLAATNPDASVQLYFPDAPEQLVRWLQGYPRVSLFSSRFAGAKSYNVKPHVLLAALEHSANGAAMWLDTDIVVNGPLDEMLCGPAGELLTTLDPWGGTNGSSYRSPAFRLGPASRSLEGPLNSAVVRVDRSHVGLLKHWLQLLQEPWYLQEQSKPLGQRNPLMMGDQDALSALMASGAHGQVAVRLLKHPFDILHHHGPGAVLPADRRAMVRKGHQPALLHAMGTVKPWAKDSTTWGTWLTRPYERLYLETSPYLQVARRYRGCIPGGAPWMETRNPLARVALLLSRGDAWRAGAVQAAIHHAVLRIRKSIKQRRSAARDLHASGARTRS